MFFLVSETPEELSVLDALKYFKAPKEESSVDRIELHHKHVNMALKKFRQMQDDEMRSQETAHDEVASSHTLPSVCNEFKGIYAVWVEKHV